MSGVADGLFKAILIGYVCPGDLGFGPDAASLMMKLLMLLFRQERPERCRKAQERLKWGWEGRRGLKSTLVRAGREIVGDWLENNDVVVFCGLCLCFCLFFLLCVCVCVCVCVSVCVCV